MILNIPSKFQPFPVYYNSNTDFSTKALTFESIGNTTVCLSGGMGNLTRNPITMYYKKTGDASFNSYTVGTTISLSDGETVSFSGTTDVFSKVSGTPTSKSYGCYQFYTGGAGTLKLYGNVNSLINSTTTLNYLHNGVFYNLFNDCQNLVDASNFILPFMDLTWECYTQMFNACYSLTTAPQLPATSLASACYNGMFQYCSSLLSAPVLPATDVAWGCYKYMFTNCKKINAIDVNITTWLSGTDKFTDWVYGVSGNGTFYKPTALPISTGYNYIPTGWTVVNKDATEPLTFKGLKNGQWVQLNTYGSPNSNTLYYSKNGGEWTAYSFGDQISFDTDETVAFSGTGSHFSSNKDNFYYFNVEGNGVNDHDSVEVYGDIMSLVNNASGLVDNGQFNSLFSMHAKGSDRSWRLKTASGLILPSNTTSGCYRNMFKCNAGMLQAPQLPALDVGQESYAYMFMNCDALTATPSAFPATGLASGCYKQMFENCGALVSAADLPALTIYPQSYCAMFSGCASLTDSPEIFTQYSDTSGCMKMFQGCSSLSSIKLHAVIWNKDRQGQNAGYAFSDWVSGVAANGDFYKNSILSTEYKNSRIPSGWNVYDFSNS